MARSRTGLRETGNQQSLGFSSVRPSKNDRTDPCGLLVCLSSLLSLMHARSFQADMHLEVFAEPQRSKHSGITLL